MVYHQVYARKKGTKRWYKVSYPKPYEKALADKKHMSKKKNYEAKMKRAYR